MSDLMKYIKENGLELEKDYPSSGIAGSCRYDKSKVVGNVKDVF